MGRGWQAFDPFPSHRRHEGGDSGAHGVTQQRESLPTDGVGDLEHDRHPVHEMVGAHGGQPVGTTVPWEIEGYQVEILEHRRQPCKAGSVVQPAVQREHRLRVFRSPLDRRHSVPGKVELPLSSGHRSSRYSRWAKPPASVPRISSIKGRTDPGSSASDGSGAPNPRGSSTGEASAAKVRSAAVNRSATR